MLSFDRPGKTPANIAGSIAKYFATSFAIENVVSAPRVISNCLPISTISISFVGLESRSTMFPASFAAEVPVFIATPTSACASAGASLVPSPVIATSFPPSCSFLISASLSSGVASARKSSTPASSAMALAVNGLSPVIMTVLMPIFRSSANRSLIPSLTTSFRWMTPEDLRVGALDLGDHQRGTAGRRRSRRRSRRPSESTAPAVVAHPVAHRVRGALTDLRAVRQVHTRTSGSAR